MHRLVPEIERMLARTNGSTQCHDCPGRHHLIMTAEACRGGEMADAAFHVMQSLGTGCHVECWLPDGLTPIVERMLELCRRSGIGIPGAVAGPNA